MVINIDKPRFDQSTYWGRARHFISITNPLNLLASEAELERAAEVVRNYRRTGQLPPQYDEDKLWKAKSLYDSAFHPDTGEKMFIIGRMSAQAPMNTLITASMITFYKTTPATVFWQWVNQSFNALVNYTNRSGTKPMSTTQLGVSYVAATGGALGTALYLNSLTKTMAPMWGRLVPFGAVCAANCINIPMMRSQELMEGTPVFTADNTPVGESRRAAALGISLVVVSRLIMAMPGMMLDLVHFRCFAQHDASIFRMVVTLEWYGQTVLGTLSSFRAKQVGSGRHRALHNPVTPFLTNMATKRGLFRKYKNAVLPFQMTLVALCVTFATPLCCALFEQRAAIATDKLEPHLQEAVKKIDPDAKEVYFNKGL